MSKKEKEPRKPHLGGQQKAIVETLRGGAVLNRFFERGHAVFIVEGQGEVPRDTAERLIARGILVEVPDAMFGTNYSYRLNEAAL